MKNHIFYCQLDYASIPYPQEGTGKGNIADNGCGICSACMLAENMLGVSISLEEAAQMAIDCGARCSSGTDFYIYTPVFAERVGCTVKMTYDWEEALEFLHTHNDETGMVIANTKGDRPDDGYIGVFSDCGHYIVLASAEGTTVKVWDPMYKEGTGRYEKPGRLGKVRMDGNDAYADMSVIREDCKTRPFFLFEKKQ